MRYRIIPEPGREDRWGIWREGWGQVSTFGGTYDQAAASVARDERAEIAAEQALASGDPLALCRLGWHQNRGPGGRVYSFRSRPGWGGCWLAYLFSFQPYEFCGRPIGVWDPSKSPWSCSACGGRLAGLRKAPRGAVANLPSNPTRPRRLIGSHERTHAWPWPVHIDVWTCC